MSACVDRFISASAFALTAVPLAAQPRGQANPELVAQRNRLEQELQSVAVVERKFMMPMRDGVRLATDIYRPEGATQKVPVIFVKTPGCGAPHPHRGFERQLPALRPRLEYGGGDTSAGRRAWWRETCYTTRYAIHHNSHIRS